MKTRKLYTALTSAAVLTLGLALTACSTTTSHGDYGSSLTLVQPANQTLARGETNTITLMVTGDNVKGPLEVEFDDLPDGVSVVEDLRVIEPGESLATFTLYADHDADPVANHSVEVEIESQDGVVVRDRFQVTVASAQ